MIPENIDENINPFGWLKLFVTLNRSGPQVYNFHNLFTLFRIFGSYGVRHVQAHHKCVKWKL